MQIILYRLIDQFSYTKSCSYFNRSCYQPHNNKIYNDFYNNDIGNGYNNNESYSTYNRNLIGNGYNGNTVYSLFYENNIGQVFETNTIGTNLTIGTYNFSKNRIGDSFYINVISGNFQYNEIGNDFYANNIANNFSYNEIRNYFYSNLINNDFGFGGSVSQGNKIGNYFYNNNIGEYFYNNNIADNFYFNIIGNDFQLNEVKFGLNSVNLSLSTHVYANYNCTIFLRSENLRDFYTALGDKVNILEPVFNKFKSGANQQELQPIIDIIRNPYRSAGGAMGEIQIGSLLGNLDTIIQKQGTSSDAKVIAQAMYDSISDLLGKGIIKRNETLSDFIVRTSSATGDKVFSMANYKKIAEKEGRQALIDQLDPLAITYHLTNVAQQQAKVKEAVLTRNVLNDFIQKTIDEFGDTEQGKKLAGRQLINLFENVNTQLKQSLPGLDAESNKVLPPFMNTFLSKSSQLAGKSMIAGNVSTMLSQLSPIVWNLAEQGIMPTLSGIGRQLFKGGVPLDKSTFLTNRFKQDTGKSLYNVVKSRYIQNDKGAIGKAYNIAKSIWSEGVVDAVTRNTVEAMDKLMSNITFTTATRAWSQSQR